MACAYCGSGNVRACQGRVEWCMSERCSLLHDWATYEPRFEAWMGPTPLQCFAGWLRYHALRIPMLCYLSDGATASARGRGATA